MMSREHYKSLLNYHSFDVVQELENILVQELNDDIYRMINYRLEDKDYNGIPFKRIYSELDPFGEENWEDEELTKFPMKAKYKE